MKKIIYIIFLFTFCLSAQQLAFPTAQGFGKFATGGRGGTVIKVTNLNDTGSGSLRQALQIETGNRMVIVEVGGTVNLTSTLYITDGNITVSGQTSGGDGLLVKGYRLEINASNVVIRHLSFRIDGVANMDGITIKAWGGDAIQDIILDHVSISWATDENYDVATDGGQGSSVKNVTIQNSIISESGFGALNGNGSNSFITYYSNLFALNSDRHVRSQGNGIIDQSIFAIEMINNIFYGFERACNFSYGHKMTALNNHWVKSTEVTTLSTSLYRTQSEYSGTLSLTDAYIDGNTIPSGYNEWETELNPYITLEAHTSSGIVAIAAVDIETTLLSHVGASKPSRDTVDTRIIAHYNAKDGTYSETRTMPTIAGGTPLTDTSGDGMPDDWKTDNGLDLNDDDSSYAWGNGYIGVEQYLNYLTGESDGNITYDLDENQKRSGRLSVIKLVKTSNK